VTTHGRIEWRDVSTEYRGVLATRNGEELRWLINRERMRDTVTGETFTRAIMRSPGVCVMAPVLDDAIAGFIAEVIGERGVVRDRICLFGIAIGRKQKTFAFAIGRFCIAANCWNDGKVYRHAPLQERAVKLLEAFGGRKCVCIVVPDHDSAHIMRLSFLRRVRHRAA